MYMVSITANFKHLTIEFVTDATKVTVQLCFYRHIYQRFTVLGAEYDVYIIFYEGLSHKYVWAAPIVSVYEWATPFVSRYKWAAPIIYVYRPFRATMLY